MDPYLWTFLARWGALTALSIAWCGVAAVELRRGRTARAVALALLAAVTGAALWTHLGPLLLHEPLPEEPTALAVAAGAPAIAAAALATMGPRWRAGSAVGFDLASLAPIALWPRGGPGWLLGCVLLGQGLTLPGRARRGLLAGLVLLGLASGLQAEHAAIEASLPVGTDTSVRATAALVSATEGAGWCLVLRGLGERSGRSGVLG